MKKLPCMKVNLPEMSRPVRVDARLQPRQESSLPASLSPAASRARAHMRGPSCDGFSRPLPSVLCANAANQNPACCVKCVQVHSPLVGIMKFKD